MEYVNSGARQNGDRASSSAPRAAPPTWPGWSPPTPTLPVLGIPMDNPPLGGMDALLATVQMPGGIPVATVAVGGGGPANAALFAARILALGDEALAARLAAFRTSQIEAVAAKDGRLQRKLEG